jgi:hypothetical protein
VHAALLLLSWSMLESGTRASCAYTPECWYRVQPQEGACTRVSWEAEALRCNTQQHPGNSMHMCICLKRAVCSALDITRMPWVDLHRDGRCLA